MLMAWSSDWSERGERECLEDEGLGLFLLARMVLVLAT